MMQSISYNQTFDQVSPCLLIFKTLVLCVLFPFFRGMIVFRKSKTISRLSKSMCNFLADFMWKTK